MRGNGKLMRPHTHLGDAGAMCHTLQHLSHTPPLFTIELSPALIILKNTQVGRVEDTKGLYISILVLWDIKSLLSGNN